MEKIDDIRGQYVNVFDELYNLLKDKKSWIKSSYAGNSNAPGTIVDIMSPKANCWCLMGGLTRISLSTSLKRQYVRMCMISCVNKALDRYTTTIPDISSIIMWNDAREREHKEVLDLISKTKQIISDGECDHIIRTYNRI